LLGRLKKQQSSLQTPSSQNTFQLVYSTIKYFQNTFKLLSSLFVQLRHLIWSATLCLGVGVNVCGDDLEIGADSINRFAVAPVRFAERKRQKSLRCWMSQIGFILFDWFAWYPKLQPTLVFVVNFHNCNWKMGKDAKIEAASNRLHVRNSPD
jgi:hypothetical protein